MDKGAVWKTQGVPRNSSRLGGRFIQGEAGNL